jgi:hypothetical protein
LGDWNCAGVPMETDRFLMAGIVFAGLLTVAVGAALIFS